MRPTNMRGSLAVAGLIVCSENNAEILKNHCLHIISAASRINAVCYGMRTSTLPYFAQFSWCKPEPCLSRLQQRALQPTVHKGMSGCAGLPQWRLSLEGHMRHGGHCALHDIDPAESAPAGRSTDSTQIKVDNRRASLRWVSASGQCKRRMLPISTSQRVRLRHSPKPH